MPVKTSYESPARDGHWIGSNRTIKEHAGALVHSLGLRYRVDARPSAQVRTRADLVFAGPKVAVFVDGCFWHGCPQHYRPATRNASFWSSKVLENIARDKQTATALESLGWRVIRIWEHEDPQAAAEEIATEVRRPSA